jgi:hypothetical protein
LELNLFLLHLLHLFLLEVLSQLLLLKLHHLHLLNKIDYHFLLCFLVMDLLAECFLFHRHLVQASFLLLQNLPIYL